MAIRTIPADGNGPEQVLPGNVLGYPTNIEWSPDGRSIAYGVTSSPDSRPVSGIALYDVEQNANRWLAYGGADSKDGCGGGAPVWAPDGRFIVFVRDCHTSYPTDSHLARVDITTGQITALTSPALPWESYPVISPDGTLIAYSQRAGEEDFTWDVMIAPLDGSRPPTLLRKDYNFESPDWQPSPPLRPDPAGVDRVAGSDRYATAAEIATTTFTSADVTTAYLATGLTYPDALVAGPLTGGNSPILLAERDRLPDATRAVLAELSPARVIALGGTASVSNEVLAAAAAAAGGAATDRIAGTDRYATAADVARRLGQTNPVYLATGLTYPDALAAGAITDGAPILLTLPDRLPDATRTVLAELTPARVIALGGTTSVSDEVLAAAAAAAGGATTDRIAGNDRYATAAALAAVRQDSTFAYIATGENFPDGLAGAVAAIAAGAPILLTPSHSLAGVTRRQLADMGNLQCVTILGGPATVDADVAWELASIANTC